MKRLLPLRTFATGSNRLRERLFIQTRSQLQVLEPFYLRERSFSADPITYVLP